VWFEFEEANTTTDEELEYDKDANHWKVYFLGQRQPFGITLFMDFGTKEMDEKIIINGLEGMFVTQTLCDVYFQFKDGQSVGAHIVILSAGSPVFLAMFQSGLLESKSRIVDIDDIEFDVFRQLLIYYLYTGMAPKVTEESITQLLSWRLINTAWKLSRINALMF
jgi:speckle-type POZ protein